MCLIIFTLCFIIFIVVDGCNASKLVTVKVTATAKATKVCGTAFVVDNIYCRRSSVDCSVVYTVDCVEIY